MGFISGFFDSSSFLAQSDAVPFFWNMFSFTLLFVGATFGLTEKYVLQAWLGG